MPFTLNNQESENAKYVKIFIKELEKNFPDKKIIPIDERLTTSIAKDALIRGGMKKKDRQDKSNLDKISATLILQTYLQMNP